MYKPTFLPPSIDLETKAVLKKLVKAHTALAELKGVASTIPNENILINTLVLQEAKDSSAIENIITTHDELFKADLDLQFIQNIAAKEVQNYATALKTGFAIIKKQPIINHKCILEIHQELEQNNAGYRKVPGTTLKNSQTGDVIYTPPQTYDEIIDLMNNLLNYININEDDTDALVKIAVIHFQFESIHPFYDGNGRTGIREKHSFYSQDLLNNLFKHPYTKIDFLQEELNISRQTASKYLNILADDGILQKVEIGKTHYFVNTRLFELFIKSE